VSAASRRKEKEINRDETPAQAANLQDQQDLAKRSEQENKASRRIKINRDRDLAQQEKKKRD
jgi:hypothetical protein